MKEKIIDRNYGSIPHLSMSKLNQQADKKISKGQEDILTKKTRDWRDLIIVTEKLDGSNVGILKKNGLLYPITRKGYSAKSSPFKQHHLFHDWVIEKSEKFDWMPEGWRVCGEWMIQSHGTKYNITEESPFVGFDVINDYNERMNYISMIRLFSRYEIASVPLIHIGQPISIKNILKYQTYGSYGDCPDPEGVVYKCERNGEFDFMAKYVRSDKEDGKYLDQEVFNKGWEKSIK